MLSAILWNLLSYPQVILRFVLSKEQLRLLSLVIFVRQWLSTNCAHNCNRSRWSTFMKWTGYTIFKSVYNHYCPSPLYSSRPLSFLYGNLNNVRNSFAWLSISTSNIMIIIDSIYLSSCVLSFFRISLFFISCFYPNLEAIQEMEVFKLHLETHNFTICSIQLHSFLTQRFCSKSILYILF